MKRIIFIFTILTFFSSCVIWKQAEKVEKTNVFGKVTDSALKIKFDPLRAPESSGVENIFGDEGFFLTHGDSFCPSSLYGLQVENDKVVRYEEYRLKGALQFDWEDTASSFIDGASTLYLGDIGDNFRFRTWKSVYVITRIGDGKAYVDRRIRFRCVRDQKTVYADTEALFFYGGDLYILTKNYGRALFFRIPLNEEDRVDAEYFGMVSIPSRITSAAVNREQTLLAVLSLDFLYLYDVSDGLDEPDSRVVRVYSTDGCRQCEGVCFTEDGTVVITNEQGDLYLLKTGL